MDCATPPGGTGGAKLQLALDSPTVWQTRGGEVRFTITGLDLAKNTPTVVACLRWKLAHVADQPAPAWTDLLVSRVGTTADKTGLIFAVTIPDLPDRPATANRIPASRSAVPVARV